MDTRDGLEAQLRELEEKIQEAERRLPAHSAKPPTMMLLLELEDQRDEVLARIKALDAERDRSTNPVERP
ncbi:MAG: hypothetical protein JEZ11_06250 [Desulfobacterales bacterium]|nr:hypothetical protein [Desulfobacterales bacterium]